MNQYQTEQRRHEQEVATIYDGNRCVICGRLFMTGFLCRKHRGNICEKHCKSCRHFEPIFYHCVYK